MSNVPGGEAFAGSIGANLFSPILLGGKKPIFYPGILLTGTAYKAGDVLGRITTGAGSSAVKASGANTGNATMSAITVGLGAMSGIYTVRMLTATTFRVEKPNGDVIGDGATGTAFSDDIGFTMTVGGTPMVAGDGFDVTVAAGSAKLKLSLAAATDGSDVPCAILLADVDATSGDKNIDVCIEGIFNEEMLNFGTGHTKDTVRYLLLGKGILLKSLYYSA